MGPDRSFCSENSVALNLLAADARLEVYRYIPLARKVTGGSVFLHLSPIMYLEIKDDSAVVSKNALAEQCARGSSLDSTENSENNSEQSAHTGRYSLQL